MRSSIPLILLSVSLTACTAPGIEVDADLFFQVCYEADQTHTSADKCTDPLNVDWDFDRDGEPDPFPNRCQELQPDERLVVDYTYAVKLLGDAGEVRVYSDGAVLGDGNLVGTHVEYQSPVYTTERGGGVVEWFVSGVLDWYDGQDNEDPCPGIDQVQQPDADYAGFCLTGRETLWVLNSTADDIPEASERSTCNQRFLFNGERLDR